MQNFLDAALQFSLSGSVELDAGMIYGVQQDAQRDYFVGLAFRY
jgi:hypothetical protein